MTAHSCYPRRVSRTGVLVCALGLALPACRVIGTPSPPRAAAPLLAHLGRVTALALSTARTCAVHESGQVSCRGGGRSERVMRGLTDATGIALLEEEVCIWTRRGTVRCLRHDGATEARSFDVPGEVVQLASFRSELLALTRDGGVWSLFSALAGPKLSALGRSEDAVELVAGGDFHCVRRSRGTVSCAIPWRGGGPRVEDLPVDEARQISAGPDDVCVLQTNGAVRCWTLDRDADPGETSLREVSLPQLPPFTAIAVGHGFTCGIASVGTTTCWGESAYGQLGEPDVQGGQPRQVHGIADAEALFVGDAQACVRRRTGGIWCWGRDDHGAIADGDRAATLAPSAPWRIPGLRGLSAAADRTCALRSDGTVLCWGTSRAWVRPVPVSAAGMAQALVSTRSFDCVLTDEEKVACRTVRRPNSHEVPDASRGWWTIAGIDRVRALSLSLDSGVTLHTDGAVRFFRLKPNPLVVQSSEVFTEATAVVRALDIIYVHTGDGRARCVRSPPSFGPRRCLSFEPAQDVAAIAMSFHNACELRTDGSLRCIIIDEAGSAVEVSGTFTALVASDLRLCALTAERRAVWCLNEPTTALPEAALAVTISDRHTCAVLPNERVTCWGDNTWGQVGNGYAGIRAMPTLTYPEGLDRPRVARARGWRTSISSTDPSR